MAVSIKSVKLPKSPTVKGVKVGAKVGSKKPPSAKAFKVSTVAQHTLRPLSKIKTPVIKSIKNGSHGTLKVQKHPR